MQAQTETETSAPRQPFGLTPRQRELLNYLKRTKASGVSPSYEQMMKALGYTSKCSIHRLVHALKERGHIEMLPNRKRSIVLIGE